MTLIARLVPIKRVDRFLRVARSLAAERQGVHFLVVGDGELRGALQASPEATELDGRLTWAGFRRDIPDVCFASDAVVLTSDNEGTPVSLIEAQAAGTPVVATRVGGVASVVRDGIGGFIVEPDDERGMADAMSRVLDDATVDGASPAAARRWRGRSRSMRWSSASTGSTGDCSDRRARARRRGKARRTAGSRSPATTGVPERSRRSGSLSSDRRASRQARRLRPDRLGSRSRVSTMPVRESSSNGLTSPTSVATIGNPAARHSPIFVGEVAIFEGTGRINAIAASAAPSSSPRRGCSTAVTV